MMNNNKILTVSYGTFSCTLEGFDDSFGTMKAIAEYFRDLASEDRYFGAEPPQPDAEMLAHIAQKEISRQVVAHQQDGQIVLKAREDAAPASAPVSKALPPVTGNTSVVSTSFAPRRPSELSGYYDAFRMNALHGIATPATDTAVKIKADTAPAQEAETAPVAKADAKPADDVQSVEPKAVETPAAIVPEAEPETDQPEIDLSTVDIVPGQADEDIKAFFDETADVSAPDQITPRVQSETPVNSSIAAKLQRIRSVVSRQVVDAAESDYIEDEHAEEKPTLAVPNQENQEVVADAIKDIETALDADDAVENVTADQDDTDVAAENVTVSEEDEDDVSALLNRLDAENEPDEQPQDSIVADDGELIEDDLATENLFESDATPDAEASAAPRGRVIKVKRADLDSAIAKGDLEEYSQDQDEISAQDDVAEDIEDVEGVEGVDAAKDAQVEVQAETHIESSLSKEEEEELARELAEVEAGLSDQDDAEDAHAHTEPRRTLPSLDDEKGSDMSRLLAETDNQMDDPESAVRRDAIAHLRAAVAAKKADIALGAAENADDEGNAYRSDLAEVVKPRRPVSSAARTERPVEPRPAPLKLVAEQRIDTNVANPASPVRPRRVAAVTPVAAPATRADGGFAQFASDMNASTLSELLEAAAAYMSFVEGLDQFSRPQLMNTVRQVEQEDFSREDGLRSFGQLLRTGKLKKLDGGRFKVSDDIGFQPDERAAG
jgi:pilus assembly protein FimV